MCKNLNTGDQLASISKLIRRNITIVNKRQHGQILPLFKICTLVNVLAFVRFTRSLILSVKTS